MCEICQGRKVVRLPTHPHPYVKALERDDFDYALISEQSYREYPCPECSSGVSEENVKICEAFVDVQPEALADPSFMRGTHQNLARKFAAFLMESDAISISVGEPSESTGLVGIHGKCGVVSNSHVASMEDRIKARQAEFAQQAMYEAVSSIQNWGSYYGDKTISKDRAGLFISEALRKVEKQR